MRLLIGNKNYSSWSLRPWLLLKQLEIPFEEEALSFNDPDFQARVRRYSGAGRVPVLIDGEIIVWDSLAIVEYVAEKFPDRGVWPAARAPRAVARSICAEMHSGFSKMRERLSMNCELRFSEGALEVSVQRDIERVLQIWIDCRARFGADGPFLFGSFSAADAYYAPVVRRFIGFDIRLPDVARAYVETIDALSSMKSWMTAALLEHDFVPMDEPYRAQPSR